MFLEMHGMDYCGHRFTFGTTKYLVSYIIQGGSKSKSQTFVHIFTKYWWLLQIYISQNSVAT